MTYNGSQFGPALMTGEWPATAAEMEAKAGEQNVPGLEYSGFDVLNIHMHGFEVAPHLFHPMGTSQPDAHWIELYPEPPQDAAWPSGQQCYCYKFALSAEQSRGEFLYHTHLHGTSAVLTWSGIFGLADVGSPPSVATARAEYNAARAAATPQDGLVLPAPSLLHDLVAMAEFVSREFDEGDVFPFVIYDSYWRFESSGSGDDHEYNVFPAASAEPDNVELVDFQAAYTGDAKLHPVLVNQAYQPTFRARTGALSLFKVTCISSSNVCAFLIVRDADGSIVPFDLVASDGISYQRPVHRRPTGSASSPDTSGTEAYISQGGGQRDAAVVQFEHAGSYTVYSISSALDDQAQNAGGAMLAFIEVAAGAGCPDTQYTDASTHEADCKPRNLEQFQLMSARPPIGADRQVVERRGLSFMTQYNKGSIPMSYFGVGGIGGGEAQSYRVGTFDMGLNGGECAIWTIRSPDTMAHPFHIHVNPFQVLEVVSHLDRVAGIMAFYPDYTTPWKTVGSGQALTGIWRDTVMVPPFGYVVIKQCYDAGNPPHKGLPQGTFGGKFVFHCHFAPHEDQGLMRNVIMKRRVRRVPKGDSAGGLSSNMIIALAIAVPLIGLLLLAVGALLWKQNGPFRRRSPEPPTAAAPAGGQGGLELENGQQTSAEPE